MNSIVVVIIAALSGEAPNDAEAGKVRALISPASFVIEVGDPLIVKTMVANPTDRAVWFPTEISSATGLIHFDVRRGEEAWKETAAADQGMVEFLDSRLALQPKETVCTSSILFQAGDPLVFPSAGGYSLRARILAEEGEIVSGAVPIEVKEAPPGKIGIVTRPRSRLMAYAIPGGWSAKVGKLAPITPAEAPAGLWRDYISGSHIFNEWQTSVRGSPEEGLAWERLNKYIGKLDLVMREYYLLAIASQLFTKKRYPEALLALDQLPDPSHGSKFLRKEIARRMLPPFAVPQR